MRVPNMSTNDNNATSADGASEETPSHHISYNQRQRYNDIGPLNLTTPGLNGLPQPTQQSNGASTNPPMSPGVMQARQPINDAVTSAFQTTDSSMSPELIQLITQNVIQQIQAHKISTSTSTAQPVQPPTNLPVDHHDIASNYSASPTFDRIRVATPPSPHTQPFVSSSGYESGLRKEVSPTRNGHDNETVSSDTESRTARPEVLRRVSTDDGMTVLEKYWGKFFDAQGGSTSRLEVFLRGVAVHLIQDYEPKNSLVITPAKMQRYYEETNLSEHVEIYPWQHIFDDKTSSISRLLRESELSVEHHLVQKTPDARPDIPGLTPHGFATWMTLLIRAHPDQEFERLLKTVREMPVNNPDTSERFPKDLSRKLFPESGDTVLATTLAELMTNHCKVQIHPRQASTAGSDTRQLFPSPPLSARNPPAPYVEDAIDESDLSDPTPKLTRTTSFADPTGASLRQTVSQASTSTAPAQEATADFDGSDVPTPNASTTQRPLERERKPYVGSTKGGKNYDVAASSSSDEKADTKNLSTSEYDLRRTKSANPNRHRPPPPIAIHQRNSNHPDASESSRARSSTVNGEQGTSIHRTRSNHSNAETQPFRRARSNSTYANDGSTTRYHPKRSPSLSKSGFDIPRASAPDMKPSSYQPTNSYPNNYPSGGTYRENRYRDRERDRDRDRDRDRERSRDPEYDARSSRHRAQSTAAPTEPPTYPDDYNRREAGYNSVNGAYIPAVSQPYQYPPTAYRDTRDQRDPRDTRDRDQRDSRESRESRV